MVKRRGSRAAAVPGSDAQGPLVVDDDRGMLGKAHLARAAGVLDEATPARREAVTVETQPEAQGLGLLAVRPPAVQVGCAGGLAQGVDMPRVAAELAHPGTRWCHDPGRGLAVAPVLHVQLQMRGVQRGT